MSELRYFQNLKPDFEPNLGIPEVPEAALKEFLDNTLKDIESHFRPVEKNGGDGLYLGTAGISYMFYHLSKSPKLSDRKMEFLNKATEYLKISITVAQHITKNKNDIPSFILGNSGVYAVAAVVYHALGDEVQSNNFLQLFYKAAEICKEQNFLKCGSDELFVGRAGYILGALWLAKETNAPIQYSAIYDLCKTILKSGRDYAARHNSSCPLMYAYYQVEYLGAAHGLCSILQALLSVPGYLEANKSDEVDVKRSIDYLLSLQTPEGNFPAATDEIGFESKLVHWCHGAGGMFFLMAKAYQVFKENKYLQSCKHMAELIWERGLLKKGPGLCHGVAGNGYVFLILYRLTEDPKYLYRAICFYEFMKKSKFKNEARIPDNPYSLYEGTAGTACFIADLMCPQQACFPFSDIF